MATSACVSTKDCHNFISASYDIQANLAMSGIDSRQVTRMGFRVNTKSKVGLQIGEGDESGLHESVDSRQMTMNLAATTGYMIWDYFFTLTGKIKLSFLVYGTSINSKRVWSGRTQFPTSTNCQCIINKKSRGHTRWLTLQFWAGAGWRQGSW